MTHRQKKQYERGLRDAFQGVIHADGRGKYYDIGYSEAYTIIESEHMGGDINAFGCRA